MTVGTRETRSVEKRRQLLDAAEHVYHRDGDLGLTVRRLAGAASTTSQTIYTYFGSRNAVIEAMYERVLSEADELLASLEHASLVEVMSAYRRHALARPAQFQMLATACGPAGQDSAEIAGRRNRLVALIGGDIGDYSISATDADSSTAADDPSAGAAHLATGAHVALAAVNGFIQAELHDLLDESAQPDKLFDGLIEGLARQS